MKKLMNLMLMIFFISQIGFALKVNVEEIKTGKKIEFINYTGESRKIDSVNAVNNIGIGLANSVKSDNKFFTYRMKYSIIHAVSNKEMDKMDADIFSINKQARVNHIKNIRRIMAYYLMQRYGYTSKDAEILAIFITYYNAVYKGDVDYFKNKYKTVVTKNIQKNNAGIALRYDEWPGKTRVVIPLTADNKKGDISSLDTSEITDKKVIETLKKQDDKGIEERKKIVGIKEKEVEKKEKEEKKIEKDIEKGKEIVKEKEEDLEKKKQELAKKEETLVKDKEKMKESEVTEKKAEIEKDKDKLKKEEEDLAKKKDEVKKDEKTLEKINKDLEKKKDEVIKEKEDIRKDEEIVKKDQEDKKPLSTKELKEKEKALTEREKEVQKKEDEIKSKSDKQIYQGKLFYLKVKEYTSEGHYNNEIYRINPISKQIELKSPLANICGRRFDIYKEGVVVISFFGQHSDAHNLVLLNNDTLEPIVRGKDNIFWRSFIEIREDNIYAVTMGKDGFHLGKFDKDLKLVAESKEKIHEDTFISYYGDFIYVNSVDKIIMILKKDDLSLIDTIKP